MIKAVIFDYDDTLIQSSEYFFWLEIEVSKKLWLQPATRVAYFDLWWKPHEEMVKIMHPEIESEVYMQEYNRIYNPNALVLFDWVKQIIQSLKNDSIKMFILSAKKLDRLEEHTNLLGIREYFEYIHWAESSAYKKPDPRVFDDILNIINIDKDQIVYVWDQTIDYEAASKAWLRFVWITSWINSKDDFEKAWYEESIASIDWLYEEITKINTPT